VAAAVERGLKLSPPEAFEAIAGQGIRAQVEGRQVLLGTTRLMAGQGIRLNGLEVVVTTLQAAGKTAMVVAIDGQPAGVIGVADTVKESSAEAIANLLHRGIQVVMLTGDNRRTAEAIALQVGVTNILAEVLPGEKAATIKRLQDFGFTIDDLRLPQGETENRQSKIVNRLWPWWVTGSTTPLHWRRPMSASPSAPGPMWRWRPRK